MNQVERNVMVDIETLSLRPDAAVISIGLAAFDLVQGVTDTAELRIDIAQVKGHIDPNTVRWWMGQDDAARQATFGDDGELRVAPLLAADSFYHFIERNAGKEGLVWANSPSFDLVILKSWWEGIHGRQRFPVVYRNERDCRTLFALAKRLNIDVSDCWASGTAHSAVDDAVNQARAVVRILTALKA